MASFDSKLRPRKAAIPTLARKAPSVGAPPPPEAPDGARIDAAVAAITAAGSSMAGVDREKIQSLLAALDPAVREQVKQRVGPLLRTETAPVVAPGGVEKKKPLDKEKMAKAATQIFEAMDGLGTNEDAIHEALAGRSAEEIAEIKRVYQDHYRRSLDGDIAGELGGTDLDRARAALAGQSAKATAMALQDAMAGVGTDETKLLATLRGITDPDERKRVAAELQTRTGKSLDVMLASELSGSDLDQAKLLAQGKIADADAAKLDEAMKGLGTDEDAVKRILEGAKDGKEREALAKAYETKTGRTIETDLAAELGGNDLELSLALAKGDKAAAAAARIHEAAAGIGTDESAIFKELEGKNETERKAIVDAYNLKHGSKTDGGMDFSAMLQGEMKGMDLERARQLQDKGELDRAFALKCAMQGIGTDEEMMKKALKGLKPGEVQALKDQYASTYGGDLEKEMGAELSGRDAHYVGQMLEGEPQTPADKLKRAQSDWDFERGKGAGLFGKATDLFSDSGKMLDQQHTRLAQLQTALAEAQTPEARKAVEAQIDTVTGYLDSDVDSYHKAQDAVANQAAMVAAMATTLIVTFATGGFGAAGAGPLISMLASQLGVSAGAVGAAVGALAGGAATMMTKGLILGDAYGVEDMGVDAAMALIQAASGGIMAGDTMGAVTKAIQAHVATLGKTLTAGGSALGGKVVGSQLAQKVVSQGLTNAAQGATTGLANGLMDESTWRGEGNGLMNVLGHIGQGAAGNIVQGVSQGATDGVGEAFMGSFTSKMFTEMDPRMAAGLRGFLDNAAGGLLTAAVQPGFSDGRWEDILGNVGKDVGLSSVQGAIQAYGTERQRTNVKATPGGAHITQILPDSYEGPVDDHQMKAADAARQVEMNDHLRGTDMGREARRVIEDQGVKVTVEEGVGSFREPGPPPRINIDPKASAAEAAGLLVHEAHHQKTFDQAARGDMTRDAYVSGAIRNEAEAQARLFDHHAAENQGGGEVQLGHGEYTAAVEAATSRFKAENPGASDEVVRAFAHEQGIAALEGVFREAVPSTSLTRGEDGQLVLDPSKPASYAELYGEHHDALAGGTAEPGMLRAAAPATPEEAATLRKSAVDDHLKYQEQMVEHPADWNPDQAREQNLKLLHDLTEAGQDPSKFMAGLERMRGVAAEYEAAPRKIADHTGVVQGLRSDEQSAQKQFKELSDRLQEIKGKRGEVGVRADEIQRLGEDLKSSYEKFLHAQEARIAGERQLDGLIANQKHLAEELADPRAVRPVDASREATDLNAPEMRDYQTQLLDALGTNIEAQKSATGDQSLARLAGIQHDKVALFLNPDALPLARTPSEILAQIAEIDSRLKIDANVQEASRKLRGEDLTLKWETHGDVKQATDMFGDKHWGLDLAQREVMQKALADLRGQLGAATATAPLAAPVRDDIAGLVKAHNNDVIDDIGGLLQRVGFDAQQPDTAAVTRSEAPLRKGLGEYEDWTAKLHALGTPGKEAEFLAARPALVEELRALRDKVRGALGDYDGAMGVITRHNDFMDGGAGNGAIGEMSAMYRARLDEIESRLQNLDPTEKAAADARRQQQKDAEAAARVHPDLPVAAKPVEVDHKAERMDQRVALVDRIAAGDLPEGTFVKDYGKLKEAAEVHRKAPEKLHGLDAEIASHDGASRAAMDRYKAIQDELQQYATGKKDTDGTTARIEELSGQLLEARKEHAAAEDKAWAVKQERERLALELRDAQEMLARPDDITVDVSDKRKDLVHVVDSQSETFKNYESLLSTMSTPGVLDQMKPAVYKQFLEQLKSAQHVSLFMSPADVGMPRGDDDRLKLIAEIQKRLLKNDQAKQVNELLYTGSETRRAQAEADFGPQWGMTPDQEGVMRSWLDDLRGEGMQRARTPEAEVAAKKPEQVTHTADERDLIDRAASTANLRQQESRIGGSVKEQARLARELDRMTQERVGHRARADQINAEIKAAKERGDGDKLTRLRAERDKILDELRGLQSSYAKAQDEMGRMVQNIASNGLADDWSPEAAAHYLKDFDEAIKHVAIGKEMDKDRASDRPVEKKAVAPEPRKLSPREEAAAELKSLVPDAERLQRKIETLSSIPERDLGDDDWRELDRARNKLEELKDHMADLMRTMKGR